MKQIIKISLDEKIIFSKPFFMNENLNSIREKINKRLEKDFILKDFIFLDLDGNYIDKEDENDFTLEDISNDKIIKIKSFKDNNENIKVILDEKIACFINYEEKKSLDESRNIIKQKIKNDFIFLDIEENEVDKEDEKDFKIEDIMKNNTIKLKSKSINNFPTDNLNQIEIKPKTTYEKPNEKKIFDLSKYDIIKKDGNVTFYKYSKVKGKEIHKLVYKYNIDIFDVSEENSASVVLFVGKTGDGRTTAINALFNIIKGIQLEDNYRFILIEKIKKQRSQAESQTDGVHIYYVKDFNNKPIILIDSQGYGDTRGYKYDEMINDAFTFVFTSVLNHINVVCFSVKSYSNRLDILAKYIFSSLNSLFSKDLNENLIFLGTFATRDIISEGPTFIKSLKMYFDFLNIQSEKYWYAFDSKSILDNKINKLSKYSFNQMKELYEEKIKKLESKSIKTSSDVLRTRNECNIKI